MLIKLLAKFFIAILRLFFEGSRPGELLAPGQGRLHPGLRSQRHDGRRRVVLGRWSRQGHVHAALHQRAQPSALDVERDGVQPRLLRLWPLLHPRRCPPVAAPRTRRGDRQGVCGHGWTCRDPRTGGSLNR